ILWRDGFWVRSSVKVELTPEDKKAIGRPSSPRWELDVVAYRPSDNVLRIVECKSYLDNPGVGVNWIDGGKESATGRFKLFSEPKLREIVFNRLSAQFANLGLCRSEPSIRLCLASLRENPEGSARGLSSTFQGSWVGVVRRGMVRRPPPKDGQGRI